MKKFVLMLAAMTTAAITVACADDGCPIDYEKLPAAAREFVAKHFPDAKVALAMAENSRLNRTYEVIFIDGNRIEFNSSGEWKEIDFEYSRVPDSVIPEAMLDFIRQRHPDNFAKEINRDRRKYEIKLDNGIELRFTPDGQFRGYDD